MDTRARICGLGSFVRVWFFFCREREGKGLVGIIGCEYGCSLLLWSVVIVASLPCTFWRRAARTFFSFSIATNVHSSHAFMI